MTAVVVSACLRCGRPWPCPCDEQWGAEPLAHAKGMVHPRPIPGCPWCPPVPCPCGRGCVGVDAADCYRRWAASETSWREQAGGLFVGSATYGRERAQ